jgi:membrane protease subunit (stomatin/prohibitin family)
MGAAMIGGAGYMAGKSGQRAASREDDEQQRISQLEAQAAAPPAQAAPPQGGDLVSKIKELSQLKDSGALTESEFEAAKAKLLAS